jgi:hypothetical protein
LYNLARVSCVLFTTLGKGAPCAPL